MHKTNNFQSLRALRAIFILMIVVYHIGDSFGSIGAETYKLKYIYKYGGYLGNVFFFMSSGFLTNMVYKHQILADGYTFSQFIFGRLKKILPIYWLTNFILIVFSYYVNGLTATSVDRIFRTVICIQSGWKAADYPYNLVGWFVNVLLLCYIIYYFICYLSKCLKCESTFIYLSIIWCVIGYCFYASGCSLPFLSWQNILGYITFSLGVLIYEIWNCFPEEKLRKAGRVVAFFFFIFALVSVIMNHYIGIEKFYGDYKLVVMFIIVPSIIYISIALPIAGKILSVFVPLGNISTQLCFYHLPVLYWFNLIDFQTSLKIEVFIYFVVLFAVCIIDYKIRNYKSV